MGKYCGQYEIFSLGGYQSGLGYFQGKLGNKTEKFFNPFFAHYIKIAATLCCQQISQTFFDLGSKVDARDHP